MEILNSLMLMTCEMAPYILFGLLIAGLLHAFVTPNLMSRHLAKPGWKSVIKAALIGVPLPLCSCGVLPTAIAMHRNGASKSATSAFLISTPQTGVDSIAATWSLLGPAFAVLRPIAAMTTALFGGVAVSASEKSPENTTEAAACPVVVQTEDKKSFLKKLVEAFRYGFYDMVRSIGGWLVGGLLIAALITEFVPTDFFASLAEYPLLAMLAVVAVAVPMYVCATGSIPIALSLMLKGLSPGTALVLLMAGPAANFASVTLLSRELGRRAAAIYIASIVVGAILFGLAADYLMPRSWFPMPQSAGDACCHSRMTSPGLFSAICGGILAVLLIVAMCANLIKPHKHNHLNENNMTKQYQIKGMNCVHCQKSAQTAIAAVPGVESVTVNLSDGVATVEGNPDDEAVFTAISAAGFNPVRP
ncbi:MAG: SO_0444 family Cu/Zn efflux transporter [Muribaculaceae bacterium]|nr:SO_0444 family Cu/Zn efflux transporter [Muribaculaceae bacterium]